MDNPKEQIPMSDFAQKMEAGLQLAYERLVKKKAVEGASLVYSVDGKIIEVPAAELLAQLNKKAS